jgi:uracil-DNA glycosylase family 4
MKTENCKSCPYFSNKYVPAKGPTSAEIVIIGEAPGEQEERLGEPFVGGAGKVLSMLLNQAGIMRQECYITNVLKCRPPKNNIHTSDARSAIEHCKLILNAELRSLHPKVTVPTGNVPLEALDIKHKITEIRGSVLMTNWGKVIPTFHPAYLLRQWHEYVTAVYDWRKVKDHLYINGVIEPPEDFTLTPSIEQVEEFVLSTLEKANKGMIDVAIDIESYITSSPLLTPVKVIGLATDSMTALVVPFITQAGNGYWEKRAHALRAVMSIGRILEHPNIRKILHNSLYDLTVLTHLGFKISGPVFDTMLGKFLVYHLTPNSLAYCVSIYSDYPPWKLDKGTSDLEFRRYNARDCVVLHMIKPKVSEDIDSNGVRWVFENLMGNIIPTVHMSVNGVYLDQAQHALVREQLIQDTTRLRRELTVLSGNPEFNPASTKQLSDLLFKKFKLKSQVKTKSGALSTGKDVLNRLSLRYPDHEFIGKLITFRNVDKLLSTYGNPPVLDDGRVHSQFKLTVITGRYGSSQPNLQNLPSKRGDPQGYIRKSYAASQGRILVASDFSQAELVVFAILSNDAIWLDAFKRGDDVHKLNGIALTGEYDPKYRTFYKNFIFGYIYGSEGGEIEKVAPKDLISKLQIKDMIGNFNTVHPNMFLYRERIRKQILDTKRVRNPFGRARFFATAPTKEDLRAGYNHPIQSTVADMMHQKMPLIEAELSDQDKIILQLHDALYVETDKGREDRVGVILKKIMELPVYAPNGMTFQLRAEIEVGPNMGEMEKVSAR